MPKGVVPFYGTLFLYQTEGSFTPDQYMNGNLQAKKLYSYSAKKN
jgi:hypothetical protein